MDLGFRVYGEKSDMSQNLAESKESSHELVRLISDNYERPEKS